MEFSPGLRISWTDGLILLSGAAVALVGLSYSWYLSFIVGFVCLHFFLFCNVCRITIIADLLRALVRFFDLWFRRGVKLKIN